MFEIGTVHLDYLTITTYDEQATKEGYQCAKDTNPMQRERKRMQYIGYEVSDRYGTLFVGTGPQANKEHTLIQASGMLSESVFNRMMPFLITNKARVTRIDVQITTEYNRQNHCQRDLAAYLADAAPNHAVSYIESCSGPQQSKLGTVYYGSRSSDRFVRIYEKLGLADEVLLRFEVEFKGDAARVVVASLLAGTSKRSILYGEFLRMPKTKILTELFDKVLQTKPFNVRVVREPGKTEEWLKTKVATSLARYLEQHDEDSLAMAEHFLEVIRPHLTVDSGML